MRALLYIAAAAALCAFGYCSYRIDLSQCETMLKQARTHADTLVVYSTSPFHDSMSCFQTEQFHDASVGGGSR